MVDSRAGATIFDLPCPGSGNIQMIVRVVPELIDVQDTGMIVESHIQTGDIVIPGTVVQDLHKLIPGDLTVGLESPASSTGHIYADTHVIRTVVQDRDILKEIPLTVAVPALLHLLPGNILEAQEDHNGFGTVAVTGKG